MIRRLSGQACGLALAMLLLAAPATSVTLGDLADGGTLTVGVVTYSDFVVQVKGSGLSADLDDYMVTTGNGSFTVELATGEKPSKNGTLSMEYRASNAALVSAALAVSGVMPESKVKAAQKLRNGKKLGKLSAQTKAGKESDSTPLPSLDEVIFESKVKVKYGGNMTAGVAAISQTPEPSTALLVGGGLLALAGARRRHDA